MKPLDELIVRLGEPQLATLAKEVPSPDAWSYELKWDGYRIVAFKRGDDVRLMSRRRQDWTSQFKTVADAIAKIETHECVVDGEVCAIAENGAPSFQLLQNRDQRRVPLVFVAFDLLWKDGSDLRALPIEQRRCALAETLTGVDRDGTIAVSSVSASDPHQILEIACRNGLEGIVAKRNGSTYVGGRQPTWLKIKCTMRQEFAIVGYVPMKGTDRAMGGLLLGVNRGDGRFQFVGKVGTGFDDKTRILFAQLLDATPSPSPTALDTPRFGGLIRWCEPRYVAEVEFTDWTEGGQVRHPVFRGLREDKRPEDCVRETSASVGVSSRTRVGASARRRTDP